MAKKNIAENYTGSQFAVQLFLFKQTCNKRPMSSTKL